MIRCARAIAAAAFLALAAPSAHADFYIGVGGGRSTADFGDLAASVDSLDDESGAVTLFAGWRPFRWIALEAFYLGVQDYTARLGTDETRADARGVGAAALLFVPLGNKVSLYAKGGAWQWDAKSRTFAAGTLVSEERGNDVSSIYGGGLLIVGRRETAAVRIGYERAKDVGKEVAGFEGADIDIVSFSIIYNF
ncbi:MAG TPA: outer membrane beta-barrel protein [Burkholderiales bacterium]